MPKRRLTDQREQATNLTQRFKYNQENEFTQLDDSDTEQPGMTLKESTPMEGLPSTSYTSGTRKSVRWFTNTPISGKHSSTPISTNYADVITDETSTTLKPTELSPEIQLALGIKTDNTPGYEYELNDRIAKEWQNILSEGAGRKALDDWMTKFLPPKNCTFLEAPELNKRVKDYLRFPKVLWVDQQREKEQHQLGIGLSAIGEALNMLVCDKNRNNKIDIIKILSDGCRILANVHYEQTRSRQIIIAENSISEKIKKTMCECERDDTLFGKDFENKLTSYNI